MAYSTERSPDLIVFQFGRFLVVGGIATALQYAVLIALTAGAGVQPLLASSIGFVASATANYTLNRRFTFHSDVDYVAGLERFLIIAGVGLTLNAAVMAAATAVAGANYIVAQLVATAVVLLWNFHANRLWTFSNRLSTSARSTHKISPPTGSYDDQNRTGDDARE